MICKYGSAVVLMVLCSTQLVHAQDCLQGAEGTRTQIPFTDLGAVATPLPTGSQAIVTSYQFQCCGEVRGWGARVQPGGDDHRDGAYIIHFQVWRPSPTSGGGGGGDRYSLVGENRFPEVTLGAGRLVSETPQPTNVISVRPGDVLGYFVTSMLQDGFGGQGIQLDPSFPNDVVYYADLDAPLTMGTASVGPGGMLSLSTNAAPIFSVDIFSSSCPPLPPPTSSSTQATPQPSPTPPTTTPPPAPLTQPPSTAEQPTATASITPTRVDHTTAATVMDGESSILPVIIGAVSVAIVLTASTVIIAIIIIKRVSKRTQSVQQDNANKLHVSSGVVTATNPTYGSRVGTKASSLPSPLPTPQQQDVELTQNQAYVATDVPVEPNQCYAPSRDQLYATVEENTNARSFQQQDYDYVIP